MDCDSNDSWPFFYSIPCQRGKLDIYNKKGSPQEFISQHLCILFFYCEKVPVRLVSRWVIKLSIGSTKRTHARIQARLPENGALFSPLYPSLLSASLSLYFLCPSLSLGLCPSLSLSLALFLPFPFFSSRPPHPPPPSNNPLCPFSLSSPFCSFPCVPLNAP